MPRTEPAPRRDIRMPMELRNGNPDQGSTGGHSVNISETGMLVCTSIEPEVGSVLDFAFGEELKGRCEVIWSRNTEEGETLIGVRFQSLSRRARKILGVLVEI